MRFHACLVTALLALAVLTPAAGAQDVPLAIEGKTITVVQELPFKVKAPAGYVLYVWRLPPGVEATDNFSFVEITKAPKGPFTVTLQAIKVDFEAKKVQTDTGKLTFAVGDVPQPVPPTPPTPPTPPEPPAPIPGEGLRALFIYESADLKNYGKNHQLILMSQKVRDYLSSHCAKEPDGTPARRFWDKDTTGEGDLKVWQDAMKRPRQSLPWVIISNGKTGYEGPLPDGGVDGMIQLLKKYGGE